MKAVGRRPEQHRRNPTYADLWQPQNIGVQTCLIDGTLLTGPLHQKRTASRRCLDGIKKSGTQSTDS